MHNSKPNVFSAIFRHKQPQNVDLEQLVLLKWIYYGNLEKTFAVYQGNACKSITDERGWAGSGENDLCQKKIKPFAEHGLRVTLECAGKKKPFAAQDLRVTLQRAGNYFLSFTFGMDFIYW